MAGSGRRPDFEDDDENVTHINFAGMLRLLRPGANARFSRRHHKPAFCATMAVSRENLSGPRDDKYPGLRADAGTGIKGR